MIKNELMTDEHNRPNPTKRHNRNTTTRAECEMEMEMEMQMQMQGINSRSNRVEHKPVVQELLPDRWKHWRLNPHLHLHHSVPSHELLVAAVAFAVAVVDAALLY